MDVFTSLWLTIHLPQSTVKPITTKNTQNSCNFNTKLTKKKNPFSED